MRILLVNPDLNSVPYFPLGIATVASVLRERGHQITVWDLHAESCSRGDVARKAAEIAPGTYGMAGISAMSHSYPYVKWLISVLKESHPNTPVVLGGPLASTVPEIVIREIGADVAVIGEGEETLPELAAALEGARPLASVSGIAYADGDHVTTTAARQAVRELDTVPFPAWDLMPMDRYLERCERLLDQDTYGTINIMASRGCPYECCYCDHTIKGYGVRRRSVDHVLAEIQGLQEFLGDRLQSLYFVDDSFSINRKWILEFCERFARLPQRPHWTCNTRVDLVDRDLLTAMKRAGCTMVRYGLESGSPRILKIMNKKTKAEDFHKAVQLSRELELHTIFTLMVGMLGETEESVHETRDFILELLKLAGYPYPITLGVFIATPYPGTRLFDMAREKGKVKNALQVLEGMDRVPPVNLTGLPGERLLALRDEVQNLVLEERIRKWNVIQRACTDMAGQAKPHAT